MYKIFPVNGESVVINNSLEHKISVKQEKLFKLYIFAICNGSN
jgi:hypothetical protein